MPLSIIWHGDPTRARGIAVVLHGGASETPITRHTTDLRSARMTPFCWAIRRRCARSVAVAQVINAAGGWSKKQGLGVLDALLDDLPLGRDRLVLVGHSSGGFAAVMRGQGCAGVVALAPWLSGQEPVSGWGTTRVVLAHGLRDRVTSPARSSRYAQALQQAGVDVRWEAFPTSGHGLLQGFSRWHALVAEETCRSLSDVG